MTELLAALADTSAEAEEQRSLRIAAGFYEAWQANQKRGWQRELVRETGPYPRDDPALHRGRAIRRGEIDPTPRYLKAQARKQARTARS